MRSIRKQLKTIEQQHQETRMMADYHHKVNRACTLKLMADITSTKENVSELMQLAHSIRKEEQEQEENRAEQTTKGYRIEDNPLLQKLNLLTYQIKNEISNSENSNNILSIARDISNIESGLNSLSVNNIDILSEIFETDPGRHIIKLILYIFKTL